MCILMNCVVPEVGEVPGQSDELQLNAGRILQTEDLCKFAYYLEEPRGLAAALR